MDRRTHTPLPATIEDLRRRILKWRRSRARGTRMPDPLWLAATRLARVHGVNPVARALHLDYYSLKRRTQGAKGTRPAVAEKPPVFLELGLPPGSGAGGTVLELAARDGSKMTARIPPGSQLDLVALAEAFWRRRR